MKDDTELRRRITQESINRDCRAEEYVRNSNCPCLTCQLINLYIYESQNEKKPHKPRRKKKG